MAQTEFVKELCALPSNSLLVLSKAGLKRIYCPFKVCCIEPIGVYFPEDETMVNAVKITSGLKLAYQIGKEVYPYKYFRILE